MSKPFEDEEQECTEISKKQCSFPLEYKEWWNAQFQVILEKPWNKEDLPSLCYLEDVIVDNSEHVLWMLHSDCPFAPERSNHSKLTFQRFKVLGERVVALKRKSMVRRGEAGVLLNEDQNRE